MKRCTYRYISHDTKQTQTTNLQSQQLLAAQGLFTMLFFYRILVTPFTWCLWKTRLWSLTIFSLNDSYRSLLFLSISWTCLLSRKARSRRLTTVPSNESNLKTSQTDVGFAIAENSHPVTKSASEMAVLSIAIPYYVFVFLLTSEKAWCPVCYTTLENIAKIALTVFSQCLGIMHSQHP